MYCRIAAEIGADIVKCVYPGSTDTMTEVVRGCPAPVPQCPQLRSQARVISHTATRGR